MEKPDGYPWFTYKCITERMEYLKEEEREIPYYEAGWATIDFCMISPISWYKYRVMNPETNKLESCVVFEYIDQSGNHHEVMAAESLKTFDARIKDWIMYAAKINKDEKTEDNP